MALYQFLLRSVGAKGKLLALPGRVDQWVLGRLLESREHLRKCLKEA